MPGPCAVSGGMDFDFSSPIRALEAGEQRLTISFVWQPGRSQPRTISETHYLHNRHAVGWEWGEGESAAPRIPSQATSIFAGPCTKLSHQQPQPFAKGAHSSASGSRGHFSGALRVTSPLGPRARCSRDRINALCGSPSRCLEEQPDSPGPCTARRTWRSVCRRAS